VVFEAHEYADGRSVLGGVLEPRHDLVDARCCVVALPVQQR